MSYYYRVSEDEIYGPVEFDTLEEWTTSGELDPNLELAVDPAGPWKPSRAFEELGMDWLVPADEDLPETGPLHPLALAALIESETIDPDTEITQVSSGESFQAVDILCAVLLEQRELLQEKIEASVAEPKPQTTPPAETTGEWETEVLALKKENTTLKEQLVQLQDNEDLPDDLPDKKKWREIMRKNDQFAKEAAKWKKFFDEESERAKQKEHNFHDQIARLREAEQDTAQRIAQLEKKRRNLEERNFELKEVIASGKSDSAAEADPMELLNLKRSYSELHDKFELVLDQLKDRTEQLETVYEQRDDAELESRRKQDELQEIIQRERQEAQKTRRQLNDIESDHRDLLLAYRDLNDRIVRDRNNPSGIKKQRMEEGGPKGRGKARRKKKPAPEPEPGQVKAAKEADTPAPKTKPKRRGRDKGAKKSGKPRLKLT